MWPTICIPQLLFRFCWIRKSLERFPSWLLLWCMDCQVSMPPLVAAVSWDSRLSVFRFGIFGQWGYPGAWTCGGSMLWKKCVLSLIYLYIVYILHVNKRWDDRFTSTRAATKKQLFLPGYQNLTKCTICSGFFRMVHNLRVHGWLEVQVGSLLFWAIGHIPKIVG